MLEEKYRWLCAFRVIARGQGLFPWNAESELCDERTEEFVFISSIDRLDVYSSFSVCPFFSEGITTKTPFLSTELERIRRLYCSLNIPTSFSFLPALFSEVKQSCFQKVDISPCCFKPSISTKAWNRTCRRMKYCYKIIFKCGINFDTAFIASAQRSWHRNVQRLNENLGENWCSVIQSSSLTSPKSK